MTETLLRAIQVRSLQFPPDVVVENARLRYELKRSKNETSVAFAERVLNVCGRLELSGMRQLLADLESILNSRGVQPAAPAREALPAPRSVGRTPLRTTPVRAESEPEVREAAPRAVVSQTFENPVPCESDVVESVPFDMVEPWPHQPRRFFDQAALELLAESIRVDGQNQPCIVTQYRDHERLTLVAGERRWRATCLIAQSQEEKPTLRVIRIAVTDAEDHFKKSTIENLCREDLSPLDLAANYATLKRNGESVSSICRIAGRSRGHVEDHLLIDGLPLDVKALMNPLTPRRRRLRTSHAIEIAKMTTDSDERISLASRVVRDGIGLSSVRTMSMHARNSRRDASDTRRIMKVMIGTTAKRLDIVEQLSVKELYEKRITAAMDLRCDEREMRDLLERLGAIHQQMRQLLGSTAE